MVKIRDIISDINTYHYIIVAGSKVLVLSSNNVKKDAKDKALDKISKKISQLKDKLIYEVKLKQISKEKLNEDKNKKVPKLGGPIALNIKNYIIKSSKKLENDNYQNNIYFTKKYLNKHKEIKLADLKKMVLAHHKHLTDSLFSINTIETVLKQLDKKN